MTQTQTAGKSPLELQQIAVKTSSTRRCRQPPQASRCAARFPSPPHKAGSRAIAPEGKASTNQSKRGKKRCVVERKATQRVLDEEAALHCLTSVTQRSATRPTSLGKEVAPARGTDH